ncbi:MAG: Na/Pi cotransporter family protein, partial [Agathobacter sp.]
SMIPLYFNLICTIVFMTVFYILNAFFRFEFLNGAANATGIAIVHSIFNIVCAVCWFPFANVLVKLATLTIRDKESDENEEMNTFKLLDERFLDQPAFAVEMCRKVAIRMAEVSTDSLYLALDSIGNYSEEKDHQVRRMEEEVDKYEDALGSYLVKVNNRDLTDADSKSISVILHCINDFERISDHAVNIMQSAKEMHDKKLSFSQNATKEFGVFSDALREIIQLAVDAYVHNDLEKAKMVEPLEQVINGLNAELKQRHIKRLRKGKCTIELGWVLQDLLTNMERVADHCSNIGVGIIEIKENEFETHSYLGALKEANVKWFANAVGTLKEKYKLPERAINEEEEVLGLIVKQEVKKDK